MDSDQIVEKVSEDTLPDTTETLDWAALRQLSLIPGGFGERRVDIWPKLLHATPEPHTSEANEDAELSGDVSSSSIRDGSSRHRDERQIQLDTERSFVLYPVDSPKSKENLQSDLHELLLSIFSKRPKLSYFQGYHDIVTVLFLTLPPELQLVCSEKLSLQRVRDSMGSTLEPVLGLLRVLNRLLRLADPDYASLLERNSPLPYYALSNLLTLFSHDMPTLPLIQHVFDWLLCRPPILVVYLAAAIVLSRKREVEKLEQEGEEGMMHSLLSGLPDISDEEPSSSSNNDTLDSENMDFFQAEAISEPPDASIKIEDANDAHESVPPSPLAESSTEISEEIEEEALDREEINPSISEASSPFQPDTSITTDRPATPIDEKYPPRPPSPISSTPISHPDRPQITLTSLLTQADTLYENYPPTHPSISLSSIMGPQSVVFTWAETLSEMPDDDEAELMVDKPELIVRPYVDIDEGKETNGEEETDDTGKKRRRPRRKLRKRRHIEKRTVVASAILVLGVAVAVYGIRTRSPWTFQDGHGHGHGKDWRRIEKWVGAALAGATEKILQWV